MKTYLKLMIIPFLAVFLCGPMAAAAPIVDFTSPNFAGVQGQTDKTIVFDGLGFDLDIRFTSVGGAMTWNPGPEGGVDGIGIVDDEVTSGQSLQIEFSSDLYLSTIYITDLFYEANDNVWYQERMQYQLWLGEQKTDFIDFMVGPGDYQLPFPETNGEHEILISPEQLVSKIIFRTGVSGVFAELNDFSVRGIDAGTAPVPEPATLLLFGTGLIGLAGIGRKRFKK